MYFKHGMTGKKNRTYQSLKCMHDRCATYNKRDRYLELGITVCERWSEFKNFLEDMGERPENKTLDRINNKGIYEPSNCRWATRSEQQRNKNNSHHLTINGVTKSLVDWAPELGLIYSTLLRRVVAGKTIEEIIKPSQKKKK